MKHGGALWVPDVPMLRDEPLAKYTAARIGGAADWLYIARGAESSATDALIRVITAAWREGLPVRVLGGGANVLVSDAGVRGLVIIDRIAQMTISGGAVTVSGGYGLTVLAHRLAGAGLSGFEWAVSVPGTVGGAVVNNAGAHQRDMAANVRQVRLIDADSGEYTMTLDALAYGYRISSLKARADRRFLVLSADLVFAHDDPAAIQARMDQHIAYRKRTQPPGASLGSIFKNPPGDYAGRLIEACGLKGVAIGGAQVSPVHANFFINRGGAATAGEYDALIRHVQHRVHAQTGVLLEPEIERVGEWPEET
ncbi:MAG: UDP-N-acetylmuramate dehydrogenase [bacterium]|nr:UDP-N-acetylmuramate dehydrogenase [bacterium]